MSILHRYIAKIIIQASVMVIFAVLGVSFVIDLLGELRDIGIGDYGLLQAVIHVILKIPHNLYQFFPMLVLLGSILGLGILSSHYELIVMRASGVSIQKIIIAIVSAASVLIVFATLIGECVAPHALDLAIKYKESAENSGQAVATASGIWVHEGSNFLHIDRVIGRNHLEGIKRYEFDREHRLLTAYSIKTMDFQKGQWHLNGVLKTIFNKDRTYSETIAKSTWDLVLNPNLLTVGMVKPEQLSLPRLIKYVRHLVKNNLQANRFQFEFWKRMFQPVTTLIMILLAIPFIFAGPRSATIGWRILFGIMIGFSFYILNAFLGQFSVVFQIAPILSALFPTAVFALIAYLLILRSKISI